MIFQTIKYRQENKKVRIALQKVYGIGPHLANQICDIVGISTQKVKDLNPSQIDHLSSIITNNYYIGSELKRILKADIQRLQRIQSFRYERSKKNYS
jgi:small subunit ribosomal protein S13